MKRHAAFLFFLTMLLFANQSQGSMAVYERHDYDGWTRYEWEIWNEDWKITNEYLVDISYPGDWQSGTVYEVNVRLTPKNGYDVKIDSAKVILSGEDFVLESLTEEETKVLTYAGDYWTKNFAFEFPSEKLDNGENFAVSIVAIIEISESPEQVGGFKGTWNNSGDPVTVILNLPTSYVPVASPTPAPPIPEPFATILIVAFITSVVIISAGALVYFKKRNR